MVELLALGLALVVVALPGLYLMIRNFPRSKPPPKDPNDPH